jgi:hypothetical protein
MARKPRPVIVITVMKCQSMIRKITTYRARAAVCTVVGYSRRAER